LSSSSEPLPNDSDHFQTSSQIATAFTCPVAMSVARTERRATMASRRRTAKGCRPGSISDCGMRISDRSDAGCGSGVVPVGTATSPPPVSPFSSSSFSRFSGVSRAASGFGSPNFSANCVGLR
jgi:hypothetical protein